MKKNEPAPIILFVYNRPRHTQQTVEALKRNELASKSELYIYSDGPKNDKAIENVAEVREYIKTIEGFSGHSDRKQLVDYVRRMSPKPEKILICHGDNYKTLDLASTLYRQFKIETKTPMNLETVRIQ